MMAWTFPCFPYSYRNVDFSQWNLAFSKRYFRIKKIETVFGVCITWCKHKEEVAWTRKLFHVCARDRKSRTYSCFRVLPNSPSVCIRLYKNESHLLNVSTMGKLLWRNNCRVYITDLCKRLDSASVDTSWICIKWAPTTAWNRGWIWKITENVLRSHC